MSDPDDSSDLRAYLRRIGHDGSVDPTAATLAAIQRCHASTLAFENLDPLMGWPVRLDDASVHHKLVANGRGGYCFEHNRLFGRMLRALGFAVTDLGARVRWNVPEGAERPRTHLLLRVDIDGIAWVADAGFGGQTPTAPLRLASDAPQATPHGLFRLLPEGAGHVLQAEVLGEWKALYHFDAQPQVLADCDMASWYLCHHPASHFVTDLGVARPGADGDRFTLSNNELAHHLRDGHTERRHVASGAELRAVLQDVFGIRLPESAALDERLQRIAEAGR